MPTRAACFEAPPLILSVSKDGGSNVGWDSGAAALGPDAPGGSAGYVRLAPLKPTPLKKV
jgi:hypothetical protein